MTITQRFIRIFRFLNRTMPFVVGFSAWLTVPAQAQTAAVTTIAPTAVINERAIDKAELLDHLDEVRRQYPALFDRLRRGSRQVGVPEASLVNMATSPTPAPRSIEPLLRQEVKMNTNRTNVSPKTEVSP